MWLLVCDSDEFDNDRKWLRSEEGEKQSQTGISRFTDVELRAVRGFILAQIFQGIHWNLQFEALGKTPTAAILGNQQKSFGGLGGYLYLYQTDQDPRAVNTHIDNS